MYSYPGTTDEIKQGDIFFDLPLVDFVDFDQLKILTDSGPEEKSWNEVKNQTDIEVILKLKKVKGIVISQDCDALRGNSILFALIDDFETITSKQLPPNQTSRTNQRKLRELIWQGPILAGYEWFYLREDERIGFDRKKAADFDQMFQVPRISLESNKATLRKGSLSPKAIEHFQRSLTNFFTRYAYNNWYSFTQQEIDHYNEVLPEGKKVEPIE